MSHKSRSSNDVDSAKCGRSVEKPQLEITATVQIYKVPSSLNVRQSSNTSHTGFDRKVRRGQKILDHKDSMSLVVWQIS